MPHRIIPTISGRKGSALVLMSFIFIPISGSQLIHQPAAREVALSWLPVWVSHDLIGWVLLSCTVTAFLVGLFSKTARRPVLSFGYGLMILPPAILAFLYLVATILSLSPTSYVSASVYAGYTALVWLISGWDETRPRPPMTDEQRQIMRGDGD